MSSLDEKWIERLKEARKLGPLSDEMVRSAMTAAYDKRAMDAFINKLKKPLKRTRQK